MNRKQRRAAEKLARRKTKHPVGERKLMSLERIEADILAVQEEGKAAIAKYNDYAKSVTEEIQGILRSAGVFDAIQSLETERLEVRKELQVKIEGINAKIADLQKIRSYLSSSASAPAPAPAPEAPPAPAPEAPPAPADDAPEVILVDEETPVAEKKPRKKKAAPAPEAAPVPAPAPPAPPVAKKIERPKF